MNDHKQANCRPARVNMIRRSLENFPRCPLGAPFSIRHWRPGDERSWILIHEKAEPLYHATGELYLKQFGSDETVLQMRQLFLIDARGEAIGTASAWDCERGSGFGKVHWIALLPEWHGQGLSRPLMSALMQLFVDFKYRGVFLGTHEDRLPAISLYLEFGFLPFIDKQGEAERWEAILPRLPAKRGPVLLDRGVLD